MLNSVDLISMETAQSLQRRESYLRKKNEGNPFDNTLKVCKQCGDVMPRTKKFWFLEPNNEDRLKTQCKDCYAIKNLKDRYKDGSLDLPALFTGKEVREIRQTQDNRCFVCGELEGDKPLQLDHSHRSGRIRGLACHRCNTKILAWLDYMWKYHENKRDWIRNDPFFYRILWQPPAEYLYKKH